MNELVVLGVITIMVLGLLAICYILANSQIIQRYVLEKLAGEEIVWGSDERATIQKMKRLAKEVFESKKVPEERANEYSVMLLFENGKMEEVAVETEKTTVMISKQQRKVFHKGITQESARLKTCFTLFIMVFYVVCFGGLVWTSLK